MRDTPEIHDEIHVSQIRPRAHPNAAASRARDTYPRMYPYVSDMYRECILCDMYLRVKIHCILKRIVNVS